MHSAAYWLISAGFCAGWLTLAYLYRRAGWHTTGAWLGWWLVGEAVQAVSRTAAGQQASVAYSVRAWMPVEAAVVLLAVLACGQVTPRRRRLLYAIGGVCGAVGAALIVAPGPWLYAAFFRVRFALWIGIAAASVGQLVIHARKPVEIAPGTLRLWVAFAAHAVFRALAIWGALQPQFLPGWVSVRCAYQAGAVACFLIGAGLLPRLPAIRPGGSEAGTRDRAGLRAHPQSWLPGLGWARMLVSALERPRAPRETRVVAES